MSQHPLICQTFWRGECEIFSSCQRALEIGIIIFFRDNFIR